MLSDCDRYKLDFDGGFQCLLGRLGTENDKQGLVTRSAWKYGFTVIWHDCLLQQYEEIVQLLKGY